VEISIPLPLDNDGFLRRQCPHCGQQFKWHYGPANEEAETQPSPASYYCPLCGEPARTDDWQTTEQQEYINGVALPAMFRLAQQEIAHELRGNKHLTFKPNHSAVPDEPSMLAEPDDMQIVTSPCHAYEPIKIPEDAPAPLHCLVCGAAFAV
jgi:hypothetical protein